MFCIFCMDILPGPIFWFWIWNDREIQILLFHWVLITIFLDLYRTTIQCHAKQNLLSFSETNGYYEVHKNIFGAKIYFIISGAILFLTLNISVARACIFLWWIETELSFFNRFSNGDDLSPYVILNALSCKEFILLLRLLLWNIQTKGQYPNWDVIYAFITVFLFSRQVFHSGMIWFYIKIAHKNKIFILP